MFLQNWCTTICTLLSTATSCVLLASYAFSLLSSSAWIAGCCLISSLRVSFLFFFPMNFFMDLLVWPIFGKATLLSLFCSCLPIARWTHWLWHCHGSLVLALCKIESDHYLKGLVMLDGFNSSWIFSSRFLLQHIRIWNWVIATWQYFKLSQGTYALVMSILLFPNYFVEVWSINLDWSTIHQGLRLFYYQSQTWN